MVSVGSSSAASFNGAAATAARLCVVPSKLAAAHHSPEFRNKWPRFGQLVREIEPCLYEVVHVEAV
jgi:hypothetical protein